MKWYKTFSIAVVISYMFDFAFLLPLNQLSLFFPLLSLVSVETFYRLYFLRWLVFVLLIYDNRYVLWLQIHGYKPWLLWTLVDHFYKHVFIPVPILIFLLFSHFFFKYHTHTLNMDCCTFHLHFFFDKVMRKYFSNKRDTCQANKKENKKNGNERTKKALNWEMFVEELRYWQHGHQQYNNAFIVVNRVYPFKLYFHPFKLYFCGSFFFLHNFVSEQRANKL